MNGEYRFLKTRNGVTLFARVGVSSTPSDGWNVTWNPSLPNTTMEFKEAVQRGVMMAVACHEKLGGGPQQVQIDVFEETDSDTRADVVLCAAALAAWKSWGRNEGDATLFFEEGRWQVQFVAKGEPIA